MIDKQVPVITIDGPSGTGKGTICHLLAKHLHWNVLDSGSIYRVLAYAARNKGISVSDKKGLTDLALSLDLRFESLNDNENKVLLENKDVYLEIRKEQCGQDASELAILPEVRAALLQRQRDFATLPGLVTDGRDMGTVVFPNADLKIFLYANEKERANRRYLQLKKQGINVSLAQVVDELVKRDTRDAARTCAPLRPAEDAIQIDTSGLSVQQVYHSILELLGERLIKG
jgi:cytidylate kinase